MKKKILKVLTVIGFFGFLSFANAPDAQAKQCWFDYEGGCDSGGTVACGVCDDDLPPAKIQ